MLQKQTKSWYFCLFYVKQKINKNNSALQHFMLVLAGIFQINLTKKRSYIPLQFLLKYTLLKTPLHQPLYHLARGSLSTYETNRNGEKLKDDLRTTSKRYLA